MNIHRSLVAEASAGRLPALTERTFTSVIAAHVARQPDKLAVRDPVRSLTYGGLHDEALAVAGGLEALGVGREAVLLMLDNHLDGVIAWWALALTGRVEVPVNTAYKGSILVHVINNSGARAMVVEAAYLPLLAEVADRLPALERVVVRGEPGAAALPARMGVSAWHDLRGARAQPVPLQPWDLMGIMYTSGTTGPSKGVRVTQAHAYGYSCPAVLGRATADDVSLVTLPLFHIGGQWAGVYNSLIAGGSSVVLPRFSATTYWEDVRRYGCTYTLMLGAMANFLYQQPPGGHDRAHPMKHVLMVPVMAQLEAFQRRFGVESVGTAYGLTEGSTVLIAPSGQARPGATGVPRADFDVRLVDDHDIEVPRGKVGELVIRTDEPWTVMDGYHDMPAATVGVWRNQWLHTGDAFRIDEDGQYVFVDRMKDAMRRRGENVSSFEVEKEIMEHPAVLEAAVVAVPSAATEDEILACVVVREGMMLAADDLLAFLDPRLPYFMVPRYVDFMDELPKTPTAKIRKQALRERGVTSTCYDRAPSRDQGKS